MEEGQAHKFRVEKPASVQVWLAMVSGVNSPEAKPETQIQM